MKSFISSMLLLSFLLPDLFSQSFKTIGYLPDYRFSLIDRINLDQLTHLNIAFANPDMDGNLSTGGQDIAMIVDKAHTQGVQVYISLAGAVLSPAEELAWKELLKPQNRASFISNILSYVRTYGLEGIDVDLEWSHVDENYSGFILEMRDSVDQTDLGLTAALPGHYRYPQISDAALQAFDWINMMVYDLTGPWAPQNPGHHSTYAHATEAIDHWTDQGVDTRNLTLGVPFYGYDFSNLNNIIARTYGEMVAIDPEYADRDEVNEMYYNGLSTIQAKTELALTHLSGIMIWEIGQDDFGDYSLLNRIWETVELTLPAASFERDISLKVYPNPFQDHIEISLDDRAKAILRLYDLNGRLIQNWIASKPMPVDHLRAGSYLLEVISEKGRSTRKLIKQ